MFRVSVWALFAAFCRALGPWDPCGDSGFIYSEGFPGNYSNNIDNTTVIVADFECRVQLVFYHFETEQDADTVVLYDGSADNARRIAKLSGTGPIRQVFVSTGPSLIVRLRTDLDNTCSGYYARYDVVHESEVVLQGCKPDTLDDQFGVVTSPNWPQLYPDEVECRYHIRSGANGVRLRVNYFETEEGADTLFVYRNEVDPRNLLARWSGSVTAGTVIESRENLVLLFISDLDNQFPGFSITYVNA